MPPNNVENRRPIPPSHPAGAVSFLHLMKWRPPKLFISISKSVAVVVATMKPIGFILLMTSHS